jgi:hypothetical protein
MPRSRLHHRPLGSIICSLLFFIVPGCAFQGATVLEDRSSETGSIVVAGFIPVLSENEAAGVVRGTFHGTVYMAYPVPPDVPEKMSEILFSKLGEKGYDLISPGQAQGVLASLLSSKTDMNDLQLYREVGKNLSAKAVLVGYLYRWLEREGTDFAVQRPASVAFDLYLLRMEDGAVIWRGKFDKTQQSFVENLLDLGTFLKSKGRWVRAEALAEMGLNELLEKFPKPAPPTEKE